MALKKKSAKKHPGRKSAKRSVKKAAKKSSHKSAKKKAVKRTVKKTAKKFAKKSAKKTARKTIKKTVKKTESSAEKSVRRPQMAVKPVLPVGSFVSDRPVIVNASSVPLSSLSGPKGMVLYFYPKDATPGCTQEACDFRDASAVLRERGYSVVGVSPDSSDSHRRFAEKQGINFPLISDSDMELCQAFGVWGQKKLYGRSFMGVVRSTFVLDAGLRLLRAYSPVSVNGHVEQIRNDLVQP